MTLNPNLLAASSARIERSANLTHLLRGSPSVQSWTKYRAVVPDWTLCGIRRHVSKKHPRPWKVTEKAEAVTCEFCLQLMGTLA